MSYQSLSRYPCHSWGLGKKRKAGKPKLTPSDYSKPLRTECSQDLENIYGDFRHLRRTAKTGELGSPCEKHGRILRTSRLPVGENTRGSNCGRQEATSYDSRIPHPVAPGKRAYQPDHTSTRRCPDHLPCDASRRAPNYPRGPRPVGRIRVLVSNRPSHPTTIRRERVRPRGG